MSHELFYTSAPRGLRPGASGFCTVAMTLGLPDALVERLESLSAYRAVFPLGDPQANRNPVIWAHWRITLGDRPRNVLSRVAFAGADYSQRSNKFAHHLLLEASERPAAGPAWVLRQAGVMQSQWKEDPRLLSAGREIPSGDRPPAPCRAWAAATGDAGWAGVLAEAFLTQPTKPAYVIFSPGMDVLPLVDEAIALLPIAMRWQVTFSTYFTDLPMGATCAWRFVVSGSAAAKEAHRLGLKPLIIDLTKPLAAAPPTHAAEAARTGVSIAPARPSSATATQSAGRALPAERELQFREDEEDDDEVQKPAVVAGIGQRRLTSSNSANQTYELSADEDELTSAALPARSYAKTKIIYRGVSKSLAAILAVFCLGVGALIGYEVANRTTRNPQLAAATGLLGPQTDQPTTQGKQQAGTGTTTKSNNPAHGADQQSAAKGLADPNPTESANGEPGNQSSSARTSVANAPAKNAHWLPWALPALPSQDHDPHQHRPNPKVQVTAEAPPLTTPSREQLLKLECKKLSRPPAPQLSSNNEEEQYPLNEPDANGMILLFPDGNSEKWQIDSNTNLEEIFDENSIKISFPIGTQGGVALRQTAAITLQLDHGVLTVEPGASPQKSTWDYCKKCCTIVTFHEGRASKLYYFDTGSDIQKLSAIFGGESGISIDLPVPNIQANALIPPEAELPSFHGSQLKIVPTFEPQKVIIRSNWREIFNSEANENQNHDKIINKLKQTRDPLHDAINELRDTFNDKARKKNCTEILSDIPVPPQFTADSAVTTNDYMHSYGDKLDTIVQQLKLEKWNPPPNEVQKKAIKKASDEAVAAQGSYKKLKDIEAFINQLLHINATGEVRLKNGFLVGKFTFTQPDPHPLRWKKQ